MIERLWTKPQKDQNRGANRVVYCLSAQEQVCRELEWSFRQKSLVDAYMQKFGRRIWCVVKFDTDTKNLIAMSVLVQGLSKIAK